MTPNNISIEVIVIFAVILFIVFLCFIAYLIAGKINASVQKDIEEILGKEDDETV